MARIRRDEPPVENPDTTGSLVASATRLQGAPSFTQAAKAGRDWQRLAWGFYNTVGEFRFACDWVGSMLSKATLYATVRGSDRKVTRSTTGTAADIVDAFGVDDEGRSELLRLIGIHFAVAGECYLVGTVDENGEDQWAVYAAIAITARAGKWYVNGREIMSKGAKPLPIRLWMPDPVDDQKAHSPARAMLPILSEIDSLTKHVAAQIDSRLAGAGILWLPTNMKFPTKPIHNTDGTVTMGTSENLDTFMATLQDAMATAIQNREDASALVPIMVQASPEAIEAAKHMTFWSPLDEHSVELRNEAIRRLALGLDMPPEVLMGVADTNHWAAWAADESAIKAHTEPLLKIVTRSLTVGFLRPALRDDATGDVEGRPVTAYGIGADTSQMRLRPNRSKEAPELYDRGELSARATLREMGFDPDDAPTNEERADWLTKKIASGSATPEMVAAAARILGVNLPTPVEGGDPNEARPDPSLRDHPVTGPPDTRDTAALVASARVEAAAEQMVFRALERAGNRMRTKVQAKPPCPAAETYLLVDGSKDVDHYLDDAFTGVNEFAARHGVEASRLRASLDAYCRVLITTQQRHDPVLLAAYLAPVTS